MTDIEKAREWAESVGNIEGLMPGTRATVEVIQSLPDKWVDVEELREIIRKRENSPTPAGSAQERELVDSLYGLIHKTPKLPTLADMTEEEQKACQWMQCEIDGKLAGILARVDEQRGHIWVDSGYSLGWKLENITPRPDLPKLQWPAQEPRNPETPPAETLNNTSSDTPRNPRPEECCGKCPETVDGGWDCTCEDNPRCSKNTPNPEDVPPNEPWLIEADGRKAIGTRYKGDTRAPWAVAALDGVLTDHSNDNEVTLIHKLVPETHALPEGMRLADHETLGRIVVSQRADEDGDYAFFESIPGGIAGASWGYVHKSELTFLGGEA